MSISVILTLLFVGFFLSHVVGPILVYFMCKFPVRQEFFPLTEEEIRSYPLPGYQERIDAVSALGFELVGRFQGISPKSHIFTTVFYNVPARERAHVTYIKTIAHGEKMPTVQSCLTEFGTEFENAPEINTNNSKQLTVFDSSEYKMTVTVPGLENPSLLYKVHRSVTSARADEAMELPPPERLAEEIERDFDKTFRRQVDAGYFFRNDTTATYNPTAKGAFLMSWKLLWPIGAVRKFNAKREGERLVRSVSGL